MRIDDRNVRMGDIIAFDWKDSNNNIQTGIAEIDNKDSSAKYIWNGCPDGYNRFYVYSFIPMDEWIKTYNCTNVRFATDNEFKFYIKNKYGKIQKALGELVDFNNRKIRNMFNWFINESSDVMIEEENKNIKIEEKLISFLSERNWRKINIKGQKGSYYAVDDGHIYNESGKEIGCIDSKGYVVTLNAKVHRLIWEAFNGKIPEGYEIDHINTIRNDNRLENLRLVTHKENCNNPLSIHHYKQSNKGKGINKKQFIGELYDCSLTDKENIEMMKGYGLEISLITLKRWRKENRITKYKK